MKKSIAIIVVSVTLIGCASVCVPSDCEQVLPPAVQEKLDPVLHEREIASTKPEWSYPKYEVVFEKLLSDPDFDARRARVALMDYYVGEAFGEDLVCAVVRDGKSALQWLKYHERCDVDAQIPSSFRHHQNPLRNYAVEILEKSSYEASCVFE